MSLSAERHVLHVDMDAFFASVEQRDHPELRGRPVVVGGAPDQRGVVSAASYEARRFGIRSAMPLREAHRRCPEAVFLPVRGAAYRQASRQIFRIFGDYTPILQPLSIDEAFLDVTGVLHLWGEDAVRLARDLRARIRRETGLTASVGIGPNKFLAKLASDMDKPDGLTVVPRGEEAIASFLAPLDVGRVWGVGAKTRTLLHARGITLIGDLQRTDPFRLREILGEPGATRLVDLAFGRDERPVHEPEAEKSVSAEHTYDRDQSDPTVWHRTLVELCETVGRRLRAGQHWAVCVQLKVRNSRFETFTRQRRIHPPTQSDTDLLREADELLRDFSPRWPVRLLGFGAAQVTDTPGGERATQLDLFAPPPPPPRSAKLDTLLDQVRDRYGKTALRRAALLPPPHTHSP